MFSVFLTLALALSATNAETFLPPKLLEVAWTQQDRRNIPARKKKRKRIRRVAHRKPPTVWVTPDVIEVYPDWWAAERARMKAMAAWYVGVAVK